jgi:hypothetical protein
VPGQSLFSPDTSLKLSMQQSDGNLVLYKKKPDNSYEAIWASGTYNNPGAHGEIQKSDGNLIICK